MNPYMEKAIALSLEGMNTNNGGPFGAVIVKDGVVIAQGYNNVTSSNDPTAHAEITAIRNACKHLNTFDLSGCEIYTSCEPCPMCLGAIYWAHIDKINFACSRYDAAAIGFDDNFIYTEINAKPENRKIPIQQINHDEGLAVFKQWAVKTDKKMY
jgi:tRNA(Arg) A34 adenosine deaminase TadA